MPALLILMLGCPGPATVGGTDDSASSPTTESGGVTVEGVGGQGDDGCPSFYRQETLPDLYLEMSPQEWIGVQGDYSSGVQQFRPAAFAYLNDLGEDLRFEDAAVRLRGNPGFSWLGDKMQFLIAFDHFDDDGRFLGLRRLALDASWYNESLLRDRLAYSYFRRAGVPAPCANHARLTVNGDYYGLYTNVERIDHEWLERVYGDEFATGGLWEAGVDVDANAENANAELITAFWSHSEVAWQEEHTDLAGNVLEWAAEAMVPQTDGYWCCSHNFYLYEHPTAGVSFVPWDLDYSFDKAPIFASPWDFYRDSNNQPHVDAVASDPVWGPRFVDAFATVLEAYDPVVMTTEIDEWAAQIQDAFDAEPHTTISPGAHADGVARLSSYVEARAGFMDGWVQCEQGGTADDDGDGFAACDDCDTTDGSISPAGVETCNRRDDDCDGWTDEGAGCDTCDEQSFHDSRMLVCAERLPWAEAAAVCASHGAELGSPITTEDWYVIVYDTYWQDEAWSGVNHWWVGATDAASEGSWLSPSGGAVTTFWLGGRPNGGSAENCAAMAPASWGWEDLDCGMELPFVCRF